MHPTYDLRGMLRHLISTHLVAEPFMNYSLAAHFDTFTRHAPSASLTPKMSPVG